MSATRHGTTMGNSETDVPPEPGTAVYGTFLKDELDAQDKRKSSFEARGLSVVTTSGVLVTLLFGLSALSTKEQATFVLADDARTLLAIALVLFIISAIAALGTNAPLYYEAVKAEGIRARIKEESVRDKVAAERDVALTRVKMLTDAKKKNGYKAYLLFGAMAVQVVAVAFVGAAVFIVISP